MQISLLRIKNFLLARPKINNLNSNVSQHFCTKCLSPIQLQLSHLRGSRTIITNSTRTPRGLQNKGKNDNDGKFGPAAILFLIVPATTFYLGIWQYNRRQWKINLLAELEQKVRLAQPVPLNSVIDNLDEVEYHRVKTRGEFDYSKEVFIGPRSLLDSSGGTAGGLISKGEKVGWHVVTPFKTDDGTTILVNRGWIPRSKMDPSSRKEANFQGPLEIAGVVRHTEETSSFVQPNRPDSDTWQSRDVSALANKFGTSPVFIDMDTASGLASAERGGPMGGQTRISLRNDHAQYMITWFGATAGTLFLWLKRFVW